MGKFQLRWYTPKDDVERLQFREYLSSADGAFSGWTEWKDIPRLKEGQKLMF